MSDTTILIAIIFQIFLAVFNYTYLRSLKKNKDILSARMDKIEEIEKIENVQKLQL